MWWGEELFLWLVMRYPALPSRGGPRSWVPRGGAGVQRAAKCDVLGFFFPLSFKPIHES